jgi:hypothetical protein
MKWILLMALFAANSFANCIHEYQLTGEMIKSSKSAKDFYIEVGESIFKKYSLEMQLDPEKSYTVQLGHKFNGDFDDYNRRYLEYYTYEHMQKFIRENTQLIESFGYNVKVVGKSLQGRDLYRIIPDQISPKKKTVLMTGRHHGDEGTANWIIEGFVMELFNKKNQKWFQNNQLVLYPMINPDGVNMQSRYNKNGRDLNRSWGVNPKKDYDEIKIIHGDIRKLKLDMNRVTVMLDMHGSFTEDFIYRVKRNYVNRGFYGHQQKFIDELAIYDPWQAGNYQLSNGDSRMARLVMIDHYKVNAMTHESIRNVPINNGKGRTIKTLMDQGVAVFKAIENLY